MLEELNLLQNHFKITVRKNSHLQVPFPSLNKVLPSVNLATSTHPSQETVELTVVGSTNSPDPSVVLYDGSKQEVKSPPDTAVNWSIIAEEFLEVLAEAVSVRVKNAPSLPSCKAHYSYKPVQSADNERVETATVTCATVNSLSIQSVSNVEIQSASVVDVRSVDGESALHETTVMSCPTLQSSNVEIVCGQARIGLLFSGGVDSVVLAALVDRLLSNSMSKSNNCVLCHNRYNYDF